MQIEEEGTIVELRGATALVRMKRSSACSSCGSAATCHAGRGVDVRLLEATNLAGAHVDDVVDVAVPARAAIAASASIYLLPVVGLLAGAGAAQLLATAFISGQAGANAAGFGGIAGAILGVLLGRRHRGRDARGGGPLPTVIRVVDTRRRQR